MIIVSDKNFANIKELSSYVRDMLRKHLGTDVVGPGHDDFKFMDSLTERHPEFDIKFANGFCGFRVVTNSRNKKALETHFVDSNGDWHDFSWLKCCSRKSMTCIQKLHSAMRLAVEDQISDHRNNSKSKSCPICNKPLTGITHVDHVVPFNSLAKDFLLKFPDHPTKFYDHSQYNCAMFRREDYVYRNEWQLFHRSNAILRVVCAKCNLTRPRK
jgi:hypothetical protein